MAKQSGGMPKIDEDFMKELISQGVPAKRESQPDDAPQPGGETETAHEGRQTETVRVEKTTNRKRKGGSGDYRETYFQKVELADRQPLYVSRTTHEKLMRIDGDRRAKGNGKQLRGKHSAAPFRAVPRRDKHPVRK